MDRISNLTAQRGISLVESLVALVVMSVGMLGIASLYVTSLQTGRSALLRTHAINLVNDMADRIRANSGARGAYQLSGYKAGDLPTTAPDCMKTSNCPPVDVAKWDLASWTGSLTDYLPSSQLKSDVTYNAGTTAEKPDKYQISLAWTEAGGEKFSYGLDIEVNPVKP